MQVNVALGAADIGQDRVFFKIRGDLCQVFRVALDRSAQEYEITVRKNIADKGLEEPIASLILRTSSAEL